MGCLLSCHRWRKRPDMPVTLTCPHSHQGHCKRLCRSEEVNVTLDSK